MPDAIFEDPRLARIYDPLDPDRGDLDVYLALADEFVARSVLDVGCGTGTFASAPSVARLDPRAKLYSHRDPPGRHCDMEGIIKRSRLPLNPGLVP